jgi:FixJ family two-component response regulator
MPNGLGDCFMQKKKNPIIYIVDDDDSIRRALKRLIRSAGMDALSYASAEEFLNCGYEVGNTCLLADIKMTGMGGLELQQELVRRGNMLPIIFITAFDNRETRDYAKKAGAAGYLSKPVDAQALLDMISWAMIKKTVASKS